MLKSLKNMSISLILAFVVFKLHLLSVNGLYSTKTAYLDSFNDSQLNYLNNKQNYLINNCVPQQIYMFVRHGARYPNHKQVNKSKKFLENAKIYRETLLKEKNINLSSSNLLDSLFVTFQDTPFYGLSELGKEEVFNIAQRYKQRYPALFELLNDETLSVVSSEKDRCIDSAKHFLRGLHSNSEIFHDKIVINNKMMRLFSECNRYIEGVDTNHSATFHLYNFKHGERMMKLLDNFRIRHEINDMKIKTGLLTKLFTLCQIENAHRMPNNWCKLFEQDDFLPLSYYNDLKGFWKKSYGHEDINGKMVFIMLKDLFDQMEKYINDAPDKLKVMLRFGHAENMYPLMTALGLFRDNDQLRSDNYETQQERKFKSGRLTPFSANVAFVLHKCDQSNKETKTKSKYDNYKISVLVNELPVSKLINAGELFCARHTQNDATCDYMDLKNQLSQYLNLDYETVCHNVSPEIKEKGEL